MNPEKLNYLIEETLSSMDAAEPVSYTHLDVYKRQVINTAYLTLVYLTNLIIPSAQIVVVLPIATQKEEMKCSLLA